MLTYDAIVSASLYISYAEFFLLAIYNEKEYFPFMFADRE